MGEDRLGDTAVLTHLFRHNTWANLKLLDFCAGLSDEQLAATAVGTYGSIRATLPHIVGAEVDYVCRVTGARMPAWLDERQFPGFEMLKDSARWAGEELSRLAVSARADSMVRETFPDDGVVIDYPLSGLLVQAINHATEHRAQIASIISQLGLEPPDMSGWVIMEETGEFQERSLE